MLESICLYEDKLLVSNIEKINDTKLEAIDIFKIIQSQYKNDETFFIMGEDNYEKMPKWKDYEDLKNSLYNLTFTHPYFLFCAFLLLTSFSKSQFLN